MKFINALVVKLSTLPTGHNPDLQTTKSKWRHEPDKKYKYYW